MKAHGYMVDVELSDATLTCDGTTKASRIALRAQDHADGPLVIPRSTISSVEWKSANPIVNGKLTVTHGDGIRTQIHFRRKQQQDIEPIAQALGVNL